MFSTDLIESKQERVAINGVEPQMIGMLVSYAYTSEVYITKANVQVMCRPFVLFLFSEEGERGSAFTKNLFKLWCRPFWQQPICWM